MKRITYTNAMNKTRSDVMHTRIHGKIGKAKVRNDRRQNNAKLRRGDYDD